MRKLSKVADQPLNWKQPNALKMAELPWPVMLGWYVVIGKREDWSGAAAAAAAG